MSPLISIIMPAYNAEKYIKASIESVVHQTYLNWELLVVNDGSTDGTKEIVTSFKFDARVKIINQVNGRLGNARNTGVKSSKGEWIAFLDADDLWAPAKLQEQLLAAGEQPSASVIFSDGYIFYENDLQNVFPYPTKTGYFEASEVYAMQYHQNYVPILSVLIKKKLVDKIGLQEEDHFFYGCEDWDFWLRMARAGANFYGMTEKLFYYRKHASNMSSDQLSMQLAQAAVFIKNFDVNCFTASQTEKIFYPFIDNLSLNLLKAGKIPEAVYLYQNTSHILSPSRYQAYAKMANLLKANAFYPLKLLNSMYRIGKKIKRHCPIDC